MFATVHTASGLLIASKISNPWWIFFIGLISHYLIDLIPHGDRHLEDGLYNADTKKNKVILKIILIILIDLTISCSLVIYYLMINSWVNWQNTILAVFVVLLPDFLMGLAKITNLFKLENSKNFLIKLNLKIYKVHIKVHNFFPSKMPLTVGLIIQLALIIIFLKSI